MLGLQAHWTTRTCNLRVLSVLCVIVAALHLGTMTRTPLYLKKNEFDSSVHEQMFRMCTHNDAESYESYEHYDDGLYASCLLTFLAFLFFSSMGSVYFLRTVSVN